MDEDDDYSSVTGVSSGGRGSGMRASRDEGLNLRLSSRRGPSAAIFGRHFLREDRHSTNANPDETEQKKIAKWRMRERITFVHLSSRRNPPQMKTVSVALVYCLNIGVDPPDVVKTDPYPMMQVPQKAAENIGKALQAGYERWQPRARYKLSLDPTVEDVKKLCLSLRKNAKDERVLFHYNGHGVPKPTSNGEIWVFNKNYTQYIPMSIYELQSWLGSPSIYVFDCNSAGTIVNWFIQFVEQREKDMERSAVTTAGATSNVVIKDYILLAACSANELLPMNPELPADVFTSCLTTPIKIALRKQNITLDMIDKIPGRLTDRKTPLGELNWIFTAITDTIAWNILRRDVFQKLFRQDLLVASLFRNFLLAERILRSLNCIPVSHPKLPPTFQHPMWEAWDLAADFCLSQLPAMIEDPSIEYQHSPFFSEQLTAFEVWLRSGSEKKDPPAQLPIVLQVLLSQAHRLRALVLLAKFLDQGSWAVNLALSVGIFPYVLRLLQSLTTDLRQVLVFIWAKILAVDKSCQLDLVKDNNGHNYFINVLSANTMVPSHQRTMAAFILSVITNNCRPGQSACLNGNLLNVCMSQLNDPDPLLRRWAILCMAKLWEAFEEAKWAAVRSGVHEKLCVLLTDPVPEVRAAVVYALGLFVGGAEEDEQRVGIELNIGLTLPVVTEDASPMVRKELIIALSKLVRCYESQFRAAAAENFDRRGSGGNAPRSGLYLMLWRIVISLTYDPFPELAAMAEQIVKSVHPQSIPEETTAIRTPNPKSTGRRKQLLEALRIGSPSTGRAGTPTSPHNSLSPVLTHLSPNPTHRKTPSNGGVPVSSGREEVYEEEVSEVVDLASSFYEWSCEYFSTPLLGPGDAEDPTGPLYSEKMWRQKRNQSIINESNLFMKQLMRDSVETTSNERVQYNGNVLHKANIRLDSIAIADLGESTSSILLHPFEPTVIIAHERDSITVWDREANVRVSKFRNRSQGHSEANIVSRTTSLALINDHDISHLLVGSDDGVVRVWTGYDEPNHPNYGRGPRLVSAWKALPNFIPGSKGAGLITEWQQQLGLLFASGDAGIIRVWDLERESYVQDILTGSDTCVTSMSSCATGNKTIVAGCGDGSLRLFDLRTPPKFGAVNTFIEHTNWILNVHMLKGDANKLVSGSIGGEVKFWEIGSASSTKTVQVYGKNSFSALAVHNYAPVMACGSLKQKIKILNFNGEESNEIRFHDGFMGLRIGPISCLSFHSYLPILSAGATDSLMSLYAPTLNRPK
ncbi:regulatory-associated protein of mTOR isoform 2 [Planoprotostelium fungivorum]|uniref:Regulatory-associated protein of mTOR isoform 2 n=1 Tax=Planoprotostelium fungivorum TaxID=1890364 RepID=A0A2P6MM56_9EUKA|nr:regulatory-associated protein of mTOR isoform 2 [Planoprotostelium fungivorum]